MKAQSGIAPPNVEVQDGIVAGSSLQSTATAQGQTRFQVEPKSSRAPVATVGFIDNYCTHYQSQPMLIPSHELLLLSLLNY